VLDDLWHTFVADPVRENVVRAHGGGATGVSMVGLGVAAFAVAVVGVVLAPSLGALPVGPGSAVLGNESEPGRPVTIPELAFPAWISLALVSTFLGVFGAVYATRALTTVALVFVFISTTPLAGFAWQVREFSWLGYLALPAALAIPVVVLVLRWRTPSPPVVQLVSCCTALLAVMPAAWGLMDTFVSDDVAGGVGLLARQLENAGQVLAFLVTPAILMAGAGAVSFGRTVTDFLARGVDSVVGRRYQLVVAAFLALLVWRLTTSAFGVVTSPTADRVMLKTLLLMVLLLAAAAWWAWATRGFDETADEVEEGSARGTLPVSLLVLLVPVLLPGPLSLVTYLEVALFDTTRTLGPTEWVIDLAGQEHASVTALIGIGAALAAWAAWAARRRPSVVAAWVGIAGVIVALTVAWNTHVQSPAWGILERSDYARAALLVVTVATVRELVRWRRSGSPPRRAWALTAFSAVSLTALVAQGDFLDDPFQPLLGFTGAGLVFFGLVWGFLTAGAHSSSTGLAGLGRTTVMLSYAVLTTLLLAWGDAMGGVVGETMSGPLTLAGKAILGGALLVALLAVWIPILFGLAEPAVREPPDGDAGSPHPDVPPAPAR
jgi:hypothetical protein